MIALMIVLAITVLVILISWTWAIGQFLGELMASWLERK